MQVLTEAMLRSAVPEGGGVYEIAPGTFVTDTARRYAAERRIVLRTPSPYMDVGMGQAYSEKPEDMTHLRGDVLVHKSHPRIALRGKLDTLQGEILRVEVLAGELRIEALRDDLNALLQTVRCILAAEVNEAPLGEFSLLGMDAAQLRHASHNPKASVGIDHPIPHSRMGRLCVELNLLRAKVREVELYAVQAFPENERADICLALNRLSSAVYLLFCKEVKNHG